MSGDQHREIQNLLGFMLEESEKNDLEQKEPGFYTLLKEVVTQYNGNSEIDPQSIFLLGFRWSDIAEKHRIVTDLGQQRKAAKPRAFAKKIPSKQALESAASKFVKKYGSTRGIKNHIAREFDTTTNTVRDAEKEFGIDLKTWDHT